MGGQSWNGGAFAQNNTMNTFGGTGRRNPPSRGRAAIPTVNTFFINKLQDDNADSISQGWLDQPQPQPMTNVTPFLGLGGLGQSPMRGDTMGSEPDEELIPTAIVIKNIPFAVKKEQLVSVMVDMGLPLPYAFNYHFDNGVFRGLAFANFTNPDETATVIDAMNHFELHGRKLRVEYKKMLPAAERERIEREKRERRGQLEEQHRPMASSGLTSQPSMSSLSSRIPATSPSPVSSRNMKPGTSLYPAYGEPVLTEPDVDLNDPEVLQYYSRLLLFKEDTARDLMVFSPSLSPPQRRIVHTLAHHMGLGHASKGQSDQRAVHVFKEGARQRLSPPMPQISAIQGEQRRALNRAATTDFSDVRNGGDGFYGGGLRHQASSYLTSSHDGSNSLAAGNNLRAAKSFADLRSWTPSPVPSTASFPATLGNNIARFQDYGRDSAQSTTPTLATSTSSLAGRDESSLINGLGGLSLGQGFGGSPRGLRGMSSWDQNPGPIGSHRSFSTNYEDRSQDRNQQQGGPQRQPRGPLPERGNGFPRRQNGHMNRGSDEMSQQSSGVEITVEH